MKDCMVPCFVCGTKLETIFDNPNQPSDGTEFQTYGHYGSTFWDSFNGEALILNICDECLRAHTDRLIRHKHYRQVVVRDHPKSAFPASRTIVGREWLKREMIPYFEGPEDEDEVAIEPEEVGTLTGFQIEWIRDWENTKANLLQSFAEYDEQP